MSVTNTPSAGSALFFAKEADYNRSSQSRPGTVYDGATPSWASDVATTDILRLAYHPQSQTSKARGTISSRLRDVDPGGAGSLEDDGAPRPFKHRTPLSDKIADHNTDRNVLLPSSGRDSPMGDATSETFTEDHSAGITKNDRLQAETTIGATQKQLHQTLCSCMPQHGHPKHRA